MLWYRRNPSSSRARKKRSMTSQQTEATSGLANGQQGDILHCHQRSVIPSAGRLFKD